VRKAFITLSSMCILFLAACSDSLPIETNMKESVASFTYTSQHDESFGLADLEGKWWIADFIFTNCETVCLPMTSNMAQLQTNLAEQNLDVHLVSFSVDPDYDTPEVLKEYGDEYDANYDNWTFVTGYSFQEIKELSVKSFRAPLKEPEHGSDQVLHDTRFFLVNPEGKIVKGYDGVPANTIDDIVADLLALQDDGLL